MIDEKDVEVIPQEEMESLKGGGIGSILKNMTNIFGFRMSDNISM